jgi:hypothetical protein
MPRLPECPREAWHAADGLDHQQQRQRLMFDLWDALALTLLGASLYALGRYARKL